MCIRDSLITVFLSEGHALIEDVPGVGKTLLAKTFAKCLGLDFRRIQFTPDLLPADITGVSVFNQKTLEFDFMPGPVFTDILLADEINRATPRTQSSLLECMEERQVTVDGVTYELSHDFTVDVYKRQDYAVHIYYDALSKGKYTSYIAPGTYMDMMYMPDALESVVKLMEADPGRLIHRNAYNVSAMSFEPEEIAASIRKFIPTFQIEYDVDPVRQGIADSWPNSLDCTAAKEEWDFSPKYLSLIHI